MYPVKLTGLLFGLYNSTHSSYESLSGVAGSIINSVICRGSNTSGIGLGSTAGGLSMDGGFVVVGGVTSGGGVIIGSSGKGGGAMFVVLGVGDVNISKSNKLLSISTARLSSVLR